MQFSVLGCHGGETRDHRTSAFLIDRSVALDAGALSATLSLEEQGQIRSVIVSHAHMDHVRDLGTLADNRCQQGGPALHIWANQATLDALSEHFFNDRLWPDFRKIKIGEQAVVVFHALKDDESTKVEHLSVLPIAMNHTVASSGFLIGDAKQTLAYTGDTGPTDPFWNRLNAATDCAALIAELSFPSSQAQLAQRSGHHTPTTLVQDLAKFKKAQEVPIFIFHIKPVFEAEVLKELETITDYKFQVLQLGDHFIL